MSEHELIPLTREAMQQLAGPEFDDTFGLVHPGIPCGPRDQKPRTRHDRRSGIRVAKEGLQKFKCIGKAACRGGWQG
jgi:hypothetical protein